MEKWLNDPHDKQAKIHGIKQQKNDHTFLCENYLSMWHALQYAKNISKKMLSWFASELMSEHL